MGNYAISAGEAWSLVAELLEDERIGFVAEPLHLKTVMPNMLRNPGPTGKLISDAYLAAFSVAAQMRLATVDRGFRQFREVDLDLRSLA